MEANEHDLHNSDPFIDTSRESTVIMGEVIPDANLSRDIFIDIVMMPQPMIRASTPEHVRKLVPPIIVRIKDLRVIYGFGEANFQSYVKAWLCNPTDGAVVDEDKPHVGGASQMITQRHTRSYAFDLRDPNGPYLYFVFRDLHIERLGEFKINIDMQVVDYRPGARRVRGQPLRYGGEAFTEPFKVVGHAIIAQPNLSHEQVRMLWWLERLEVARPEWRNGQVGM